MQIKPLKVNRIATNENGSIELPIHQIYCRENITVHASLNDSASYTKSEIKKTATIKEIPVKYTISGYWNYYCYK